MSDKTKKYGLTESSMISESDLIERIEQIIKGSPITHYRESAEMAAQLCIESDEAREYWREHDKEEFRQGMILNEIISDIEKQFIEQAYEAVDEVFNNGNYVSVNRFDIKQAIKDKFK